VVRLHSLQLPCGAFRLGNLVAEFLKVLTLPNLDTKLRSHKAVAGLFWARHQQEVLKMSKSQSRVSRIKTAATELSKEINAELGELKARVSQASGSSKRDLELRIEKLKLIGDGVVHLCFGHECPFEDLQNE